METKRESYRNDFMHSGNIFMGQGGGVHKRKSNTEQIWLTQETDAYGFLRQKQKLKKQLLSGCDPSTSTAKGAKALSTAGMCSHSNSVAAEE